MNSRPHASWASTVNTWATPPALLVLVLGIIKIGSHKLFVYADFELQSSISAFWVVRITGLCHQHPAVMGFSRWGFTNYFPRPGFELCSIWSLPLELLGLQAWAASTWFRSNSWHSKMFGPPESGWVFLSLPLMFNWWLKQQRAGGRVTWRSRHSFLSWIQRSAMERQSLVLSTGYSKRGLKPNLQETIGPLMIYPVMCEFLWVCCSPFRYLVSIIIYF
jgi:hypothetical protein